MTASHGVGTYGNGVGTVTPLDHKLGQAGLIAKSSGILIRPGVFWGGTANLVVGKANMSYDVLAFDAVLTRGAAAGCVLIANPGTFNVVTTAAPGSNSRYDVVYLWQREFSLDGTDSEPVIGVINGTAAASPTVPSLAAFPGAIELARILVPAGVTATNTGTTITQKFPITTADGGRAVFPDAAARDRSLLAPSLDDRAYLIADNTEYRWNSSTWQAWNRAQAAWSPTVTGSLAIGTTGSFAGSLVSIVEGWVEAELKLVCTGSSIAWGSANFAAPIASATTPSVPTACGMSIINDANGSIYEAPIGRLATSGDLSIYRVGVGGSGVLGSWASSPTFTLQTGDSIHAAIRYSTL